jgi:membrane-associated protein
MLDRLADLGDAAAYALIFAIVAGDSVVPAFPGETATLAGAVLAARGELSIVAVLTVTWLGAVVGDNVTFWFGGTGGRRLVGRWKRRDGGRLEWMRARLDERGPGIILVARFIPGGRNAVSVAAGTLGMPWSVFVVWDALAAALWALYATGLGYATGRTVERGFLLPLAISLGLAALAGVAGELVVRRRRRSG